jgi:hypothetical protein
LWFNSVYMKNLKLFLFPLSLALFSGTSWAAEVWVTPSAQIDAIYPQVESLYLDLHSNPELSLHEEKTAAKIADRLRKLGYDVTTNVGGTGVVFQFRRKPGCLMPAMSPHMTTAALKCR